MLKIIPSEDLICMNRLADEYGFRVDLVYATDNNALFGERIYRKDAQLFLHRLLAPVVCNAAAYCLHTHQARFVLYDGLRTTEAQERMIHTARVRDNPHWLIEPRLLSPPGAGGHPRGMAIDIGLETLNGDLLDMVTPFDFLAENPHADYNPAHRDHPHLSETVRNNRKKLDESMNKAADELGVALFPLPQEWWDYRLPAAVYEQYAPLSDSELPSAYLIEKQ